MIGKLLHASYWVSSGLGFRARRRFTPAGFLVLSGAGLAWILLWDTLFSVAYQGAVFLTVLMVVALVLSLRGPGKVRVSRELPRYGTLGEPLRYWVRIRNESRHRIRGLELWEDLVDPRPGLSEFRRRREPGEQRRNVFDRFFGYYRWRWLLEEHSKAEVVPCRVPELAPGLGLELQMELRPWRRGRVNLRGMLVGRLDPFGLCRGWRRVTMPGAVVILPRRYAVPRIPLAGIQQYQPRGVSLARSVGDSEEFVGVRDYRWGDPWRRIHWRSWAKVGWPIVKEYEEEFYVRHALILDTFLEGGEESVFEEAVSVAASFGCTVEDDDSLLDLMFVGAEAYCFTAGRGLGHPEQMLEVLAGVVPCEGDLFEALESLVMRHVSVVSGCVCVLVGWDQKRQELVRQLESTGVPVVTLVIIEAGPEERRPERAASVGQIGLRHPERVHFLEVGEVRERLVAICKHPLG